MKYILIRCDGRNTIIDASNDFEELKDKGELYGRTNPGTDFYVDQPLTGESIKVSGRRTVQNNRRTV